MNKFRSMISGGIFCCFAAMLTGCGSSELVDMWSNPSFQATPLNKMLVISASKNSVHRRIWEDAFSAEFVKHGVASMPSYRFFPDALPDTEDVLQCVKKNGFDGVLVIRRLPPEAIALYMQGHLALEQDTRLAWRRYGFVPYYRDVWRPAYIDSQKTDIRAIDVWSTKDEGQMIWSATSKTPEPNSIQDVRPDIVGLVLSELKNRNIVAAER